MRMPLATILVALSFLAGCAGGPDSTGNTGNTGSTGNTATGAAPSRTPAQDDCGGAAERIKQHLKVSEVDKVVIQGQCTSAIIRTTLGDDANEPARKLCEKAAEVAYVGDLNAVTVLGSSGRELAIGITGAKCMASH